jgi:hypothetical protein
LLINEIPYRHRERSDAIQRRNRIAAALRASQ